MPGRIVRDVYNKFKLNPSFEIKGSDLKPYQREFFCQKVNGLLAAKPDFKIGAITVKKEQVMSHIRADGNKLYNYMMKLSLLDKTKNFTSVNLIRDERSVKVKTGNTCIDYLQISMWFEHQSKTQLKDFPTQSHKDDGLIFTDWICNSIWSKHEDGFSLGYDLLSGNFIDEKLWF